MVWKEASDEKDSQRDRCQDFIHHTLNKSMKNTEINHGMFCLKDLGGKW